MKSEFIKLTKPMIKSGMKVKVKAKKSELACMVCLPLTSLKDHPTYNGILVHSRIDCPPVHVYFMNDADFIDN